MNVAADSSFTSTHSKEEFKFSSEVSTRLDLGHLYMAHSEVKMLQSPRKLEPGPLGLQAGIESGFDFNSETSNLTVVVKLKVKGIVESDLPEIPKGTELIEINCAYAVEAKLMRPFESAEDAKQHFEAFTSIASVLIVWPSMREFVMSASARAGLAPLVLPYFKVLPKSEQDPGKV